LALAARGGGQEIGETRVNRQIGTAEQCRHTGQSYLSGSASSPARESSNTNNILPIQRRQRWNVQPYATSSEPLRNAQRLCAVSTEVVEADSASNAIDDCALAACDFRTHIDFFARYTADA